MREEDDPQAASLERSRVEERYAGFAGDPRTQRAWAASNPGNQAIRAELEEAVCDVMPSGPLLDVGCGTGWWLQACDRRSDGRRELAGLEIQDGRAAAARLACPAADVQVGDATRLPWPDRRFAVTTLFTVLSSLRDDRAVAQALAEASRVTRVDGLVVVWEPRWPSPRGRRSTVRRQTVRTALGATVIDRSITLAPPLARRVGGRGSIVAALSAVPTLRSHYLLAGHPA